MKTTTGLAILSFLGALSAVSTSQAMSPARTDLCVEQSDHSCKNNGCASTCGHPFEFAAKSEASVAALDNCWCLGE
jgi:hypothetical protein